jgi:hypothetical protein
LINGKLKTCCLCLFDGVGYLKYILMEMLVLK